MASRLAGVVGVAEELVVPQGVVGVVHRQRHPGRWVSGGAGGVGGVEVAGERAQRPAVGGDVVDQQYQHVLVGAVCKTVARIGISAARSKW
ncbi:hypothetical protein MM1218R_03286 [Mycobacterium marinum]|nr:hypothetical protein MM1218R_03286 [Mycobacterium marinum]